ncbi:MAG TPA: flagellar filament capping protein FliD [Sphingomonas sp.]|uniref:flagellar filament capping protein FliD n=1 Tax=Sphingomonas sp. TaxID=28214 RepID=UPI002ED82065
MASISTSLGLGSGIDTTQLVTDLAAASRAPKEQRIAAKETANKAQVSALADAASGLANFDTALTTLISGGTLATQPTTSNATMVTATALTGARLTGLSAQIEIKALAMGQNLTSKIAVGRDVAFGAGSFTITKGGEAKPITINADDSSLAGIARAINAAGAGVTASVVTQGANARLVLKGATGAENGFTVQASGAFADLAYDGTDALGMKSTQTAQDAVVVIDSIEATRSTNSIADLIPGVQLELKKVTGTDGVAIGAAPPTDAIRTAIQDFAGAFNELKKSLDELTSNGFGGTTKGPLYGDIGVAEMRRQLARLTSTTLSSGGSPSTLTELGVKTERDGSLSVDTKVLDKMLSERLENVEGLFNPTQRSSTPLLQITSEMGKTKPGTYKITDIEAGPPAKAMINGKKAVSIAGTLSASGVTEAAGLSFTVKPGITSATITVDSGIGGALSEIRKMLTKDVENEDEDGPLTRARDFYKKRSERLTVDRKRMETQEDAYKAKLTKSFTGMEKRVTALNATKAYLTQQIDQWNNSNN